MKAKIQTGIYKHYKGNRYLVLGLAMHSETEEAMVVYVPLDKKNPKKKTERQRMCVRPLKGDEGFTNIVNKPEYKYKGPRFALETAIDFNQIP